MENITTRLLEILEESPELTENPNLAIANTLSITDEQVQSVLAAQSSSSPSPAPMHSVNDAAWTRLKQLPGGGNLRRYGNYSPASVLVGNGTFAGRATNYASIAGQMRNNHTQPVLYVIAPVDSLIPDWLFLVNAERSLDGVKVVILDTVPAATRAVYDAMGKRVPRLPEGNASTRRVPFDFAGRANRMSEFLQEAGFEVKHSIDVSTAPATGGRVRENHIDLILQAGRFTVVLGEPTLLSATDLISLIAPIVEAGDEAPAEEQGPDYTEQITELTSIMARINSSVLRRMNDITSLRQTVDRLAQNANDHLRDYTAAVRQQHDTAERIRVESPRAVIDGIEDFKRSFQTVDNINRLRGIESCSMDGTSLVLNLRPYIMHIPGPWRDSNDRRHINGGFIRIEPHTLCVETSRPSFSEANVIISRENGRVWHPHVSGGGGCFGNAVARIGEAWGRRDWESVTHMLLQWWTAYNDRSPYNRPNQSMLLPNETAARWVLPEVQLEIPTTEATPELELANA